MNPQILCPSNIYIATEYKKMIADWVRQEHQYQSNVGKNLGEHQVEFMIQEMFLSFIIPAGQC